MFVGLCAICNDYKVSLTNDEVILNNKAESGEGGSYGQF